MEARVWILFLGRFYIDQELLELQEKMDSYLRTMMQMIDLAYLDVEGENQFEL